MFYICFHIFSIYIGNFIPTDEVIYFSEGSTSNQIGFQPSQIGGAGFLHSLGPGFVGNVFGPGSSVASREDSVEVLSYE